MSYKNNYTKPKSKATKVVIWVAVILVVCALCGLIPNFFNHKDGDFERVYVGWTVGGLDESGKFDSEIKDSMVSDRIELEAGVKIHPDFNSGITFDIYYYDDNDGFISNEDTFDTITTANHDPDATYIRIVAHPVDKNNVINAVEKYKYANLLEIFKAPLEDDVTEE